MKKEAQLKLSFGEMDRLLKRQEFSTAYIALNQKVRGFAPSYFQAFKFAFYNIKSDEALLDKKGIEVKRKTPEAKKPSYNQYLDYAEGIELDEASTMTVDMPALEEISSECFSASATSLDGTSI